MKPCSHKHVEARIWSRQWKEWCVVAPTYRGQADALICRDCGEWLGLGESDEKGERVAVEIKAAALVAGDAQHDDCEHCGWCNSESGTFTPPLSNCNRAEFDAGYLAREISVHDWLQAQLATHSEPQ